MLREPFWNQRSNSPGRHDLKVCLVHTHHQTTRLTTLVAGCKADELPMKRVIIIRISMVPHLKYIKAVPSKSCMSRMRPTRKKPTSLDNSLRPGVIHLRQFFAAIFNQILHLLRVLSSPINNTLVVILLGLAFPCVIITDCSITVGITYALVVHVHGLLTMAKVPSDSQKCMREARTRAHDPCYCGCNYCDWMDYVNQALPKVQQCEFQLVDAVSGNADLRIANATITMFYPPSNCTPFTNI
jgi:hypothetical protein